MSMITDAAAMESEEVADADPRRGEADVIVRNHTLYAATSGLIPIPVVDVAASTTIQIRMIARLCEIYGLTFSQQAVKSAISALVAASLPYATVGIPLMSAVKGIPVFGYALTVATMPVLNGAVTFALGRVFAWHFAHGGTLASFDPGKARARFRKEMEAGRSVVASALREGDRTGAAHPADPAHTPPGGA